MTNSWNSCFKPLCGSSISDGQACYKAKTSNGTYMCVPTAECDDFDTCDKEQMCSTSKSLCIIDSCCGKSLCVPRLWVEICRMKKPADADEAFWTYINRVVYIQSVNHPDRYLALSGSEGGVNLLPLSSDTIVFVMRPCVWKPMQTAYPNFACVTFQSYDGKPIKTLQHGNFRVFMKSLFNSNGKENEGDLANSSFMLVGGAK
ncbi:unnamed protein product, partial [Rotaria socialis]